MEQYSGNSKKSKQEKLVPVNGNNNSKKAIRVNPVIKKKSEVRKVMGSLVSDDLANVKNTFVYDWLIPNIRQGLWDTFGMILGFDPGYGPRNNKSYGSRTQYGGYYDNGRNVSTWSSDRNRRERDEQFDRRPTRAGYDYEDVTLTKGEAELILDEMATRMSDADGWCTVLDLYDMLQITPPPTAINYGWDSMDRMRAARDFDGRYRLDLPRPILISGRR